MIEGKENWKGYSLYFQIEMQFCDVDSCNNIEIYVKNKCQYNFNLYKAISRFQKALVLYKDKVNVIIKCINTPPLSPPEE